MKRPNAILHMTGYGLFYGLGILYVGFLMFFLWLGINDTKPEELSLQFSIVAAFLFGSLFGTLPGLVIGFIEGCILWSLTRTFELPMSKTKFENKRKYAMKFIGCFAFIAMLFLMGLLYDDSMVALLFIVIPSFLAAAEGAYAVHRYMLKLRAWANVGKVKNDHKLKNQLTDTDFRQNGVPLTNEAESQRDSLTS
jgi:hypothetical protein